MSERSESPSDTRVVFDNGPYVQGAFLCERVLQEADGTLSAIRIVDRWTHAAAPGSRETVPPISVELTLLLMFKAGDARGSHEVSIQLEEPSGTKGRSASMTVLFEGQERGVNIPQKVRVEAAIDGLYWFDVRVDSRLITRVPLRVVRQRISIQ